jgi:hypothetical protein
MNWITYLHASGMKIGLAIAVTVPDCTAFRRCRAVKIHFLYSEKILPRA